MKPSEMESRSRREDDFGESESEEEDDVPPKRLKSAVVHVSASLRKPKRDDIMMKTGGAYIPPAKLKLMQQSITDKSSESYQRLAWEALKKSINGIVNKVNVSNFKLIINDLFAENLVRGRGLLCRSLISAQSLSPTFVHIFAAIIAVVNSRIPMVGELIVKRLVIQFKFGCRAQDKARSLSSSRFIAHLVNVDVADDSIALEILVFLLETPTEDSVELAIGFVQACSEKLTNASPVGFRAIFERLRSVQYDSSYGSRSYFMVEAFFQHSRGGFKEFPATLPELGLEEIVGEESVTHCLSLGDKLDAERSLDVFKLDHNYLENEEKYKRLRMAIIGGTSDSEDSGSGGSDDDSDSEDSDNENEENPGVGVITDETNTNIVALRRTIYLTLRSSLDFQEAAHKLLKMQLKPGQEMEVCNMILDFCALSRTYEKFSGLLAQRLCMINRSYQECYESIFAEQYDTCYRMETNKLRNVAKMLAHLLHSDAISWGVLQQIRLTEEDTTSSSRIFIKILFLELSEYLGLVKLHERLSDVTLAPFFEGLFPRDSPKNTRFAINYFTSIGLGGLTDELRDHLDVLNKKNALKSKMEREAQREMARTRNDSS